MVRQSQGTVEVPALDDSRCTNHLDAVICRQPIRNMRDGGLDNSSYHHKIHARHQGQIDFMPEPVFRLIGIVAPKIVSLDSLFLDSREPSVIEYDPQDPNAETMFLVKAAFYYLIDRDGQMFHSNCRGEIEENRSAINWDLTELAVHDIRSQLGGIYGT